MTAAMDSPDRIPIVASSDSQGSPFFHFLCTLSPIKPVRSGHRSQTFSELSFPPPPAVFVSPKVEAQREITRSKRKILGGLLQNVQIEEKDGHHEASHSSSHLLSNVEKESVSWTNGSRRDASGNVCISTVPCGDTVNSKITHTIEGCAAETDAEVSHNLSGRTANSQSEDALPLTERQPSMRKHNRFTSEEPSLASPMNEPRLCRQQSSDLCVLSSNHAEDGEASFEHRQIGGSNFNSNIIKIVDQSVQGLSCQTISEKENIASNIPTYDLKQMAQIWPAPLEYLSKLLASMHGMVDQKEQTEDFRANFAHNKPSDLDGNEDSQGESGLRGSRAINAGIRRRCLDFEASEKQQKALDSLPLLRMIGLSSNNPSRNSTLDANRATVFFENNTVKYGSMENQLPKIWDHGTATSSNLQILPQIPNPRLTPTMSLPPAVVHSRAAHSGFSFGGEPACTALHHSGRGFSMAPAAHSTDENSGTLPFSARLMSLEDLKESLLESEKNQGTICDHAQSADNLNPKMLLSLVDRTTMNQHDELLGMARSTDFYQSIAFGIQPIQENLNTGEPESRSASLLEKTLQETSESDHPDDSMYSPTSPKKKRKLINQAGDNTGEGCKNCKCKKSKCLKLYCECFASGVYCIDICNCNDCYNKPEYEETVLGTRQQIESRNPLAFVPKIIRASDSSPTMGEESNETPASARHKRGCNCKKSQCLKKYCECYQAGVGCADGCRCEGCKNIYGRNEGSSELEDKDQQNGALEMKQTTNDEIIDIGLKLTPEHQNEQQITDLSPITPYLENLGQCRSSMELRSTERLASPFTHPISTLAFQSPSQLLELLEETDNFSQVNLQPYQAAGTRIGPDFHQPSHGWNGQDAIYTLTPLSQPLQRLAPMVVNAVLNRNDACHPSWQRRDFSTSTNNACMPGLTNQSINPSALIQEMAPSSFSPDTSCQFQTPESALAVPVTPLLSTTHASRPNYDFDELSENQCHQSAWFTDEDESLNVLRELNTFCAPDVVMRTRSPQQKRIFSYQQGTNLKNIISPGLASRNGRKFVLHALPSSSYPEKPTDNV